MTSSKSLRSSFFLISYLFDLILILLSHWYREWVGLSNTLVGAARAITQSDGCAESIESTFIDVELIRHWHVISQTCKLLLLRNCLINNRKAIIALIVSNCVRTLDWNFRFIKNTPRLAWMFHTRLENETDAI